MTGIENYLSLKCFGLGLCCRVPTLICKNKATMKKKIIIKLLHFNKEISFLSLGYTLGGKNYLTITCILGMQDIVREFVGLRKKGIKGNIKFKKIQNLGAS